MGSPMLASLPPEILGQIITNLDPVSLISLSQTSRGLRAFIGPTRHDFARRLLALELMPEHGGIVPVLRVHGHGEQLSPPWDSEEWKRTRYACCGCMKLLPHMMFDNHAILRLPYRKPPPGTIEAEQAFVTDWEPLEPRARWKNIQARADRARDEQRERRNAVTAEYRKLVTPPGQPFVRLSRTQVIAAELEAERYICGTSRHRRRCVECQHRRGHWSRLDSHRGTAKVPVVPSRRLHFTDRCEIRFAGLFEPVPLEKVPRLWLVYRAHVGDEKTFVASLFVARCPACGVWQKQGGLRLWHYHGRFPENRNSPPDSALCNRCYLETHRGSESSLAEMLSAAVLTVLREDRESLIAQLGFGWGLLYRDFLSGRLQSEPVGREVLGGLKWSDNPQHEVIFNEADLPDYRRRVARFRTFLQEEADERTRRKVMQAWFQLWLEDYDLLQENYYRLKRRIAWVEENPNVVLDYVTKHDPYRICP
ncbi:hypothetical protein VTK26DRAFT_6587 [Humicola hyalothermophila]